jgi:hypothetical protein
VPKPSRIEFDLGPNPHGQRIRLLVEGDRLTLLRDPANQLDDSARIELTADQCRELADAANG